MCIANFCSSVSSKQLAGYSIIVYYSVTSPPLYTSMTGNLVYLLLTVCVLLTVCHGQTCSNSGRNADGTCYMSSSSCRGDHPNEMDECGVPLHTIRFPELDSTTERCPTDEYDVVLPCASNSPTPILANPINYVNVSLHALDSFYFAINISWDHQSQNSSEGYQLRFKRGREDDVKDCICFYSPDKRTLYYDDSIALIVPKYEFDGNDLVVELSQIGVGKAVNDSMKWPKTCLDINHNSSTCFLPNALPIYAAPSNVTVCKYYSPSENLSLNIEWDYMTDYIDPTIYYIKVLYQTFVANNTRSVTISGLDDSSDYKVIVSAYVHCSGAANHRDLASLRLSLGCSKLSNVITPDVCPSPTTESPAMTYTSSVTSTAVNSPPLTTIPVLLGANRNIILGSGVAGGSAVVVIISVSILVILLLLNFSRRKPNKHLPLTDYSVFLVHAPHTSREKEIYSYVVCRLREYFNVVTSSGKERGDIIQWMEEQERKAKAVLLVFTKEFLNEWNESEKSKVVASVQALLHSAVSLENLDKYAIIVLDEKAKDNYIPDNHYLKSLNVYVLGKERNQEEDVYRFVTRLPIFGHHEGSPPSSIGSSDDKSQCTVSIDINNLNPFGSQEDYPDQKLDQSGTQKDTLATMQAGTGSVQSKASNFQSEQLPHQILQILTAPYDSESPESPY